MRKRNNGHKKAQKFLDYDRHVRGLSAMSSLQMPGLKSLLNAHLDHGLREVRSETIVTAAGGDLALASFVLAQWQQAGWVKIIRSLQDSKPDDVCLELRAYIDNDRPWSEPMSGKM